MLQADLNRLNAQDNRPTGCGRLLYYALEAPRDANTCKRATIACASTILAAAAATGIGFFIDHLLISSMNRFQSGLLFLFLLMTALVSIGVSIYRFISLCRPCNILQLNPL